MTSLANETGGRYFPVPDSTQLPSIYTAIRNIMAGDYTLTYVPSGSSFFIRLRGNREPRGEVK